VNEHVLAVGHQDKSETFFEPAFHFALHVPFTFRFPTRRERSFGRLLCRFRLQSFSPTSIVSRVPSHHQSGLASFAQDRADP
jgi:hypothetical protein